MKSIKDLQVAEKRVIVRCDFNVPLDNNGNIVDDFRIRQSLPTISYLSQNKAKVILISHLGRPKIGFLAKADKKRYSLAQVAERLAYLLSKKVFFVRDCQGRKVKEAIDKMKGGEVVLLENLRFYKGEEANDEKFAKSLASLGDIYVNDAFSVCHREHASIVSLPKLLPSAAGFSLEKEVKILLDVIKKPKRPLVVIIGGKKLNTKIAVIKKLLEISDHLLLGGQIANAILTGKGIVVGRFLEQGELAKEVSDIQLTNPKLHLPVDAIVGLSNLDKGYIHKVAVGKVRSEEEIYDIGSETIRIFSDIINAGKTVLWNGPLGYVEDQRFVNGSFSIADVIIRSGAFSIVGGGDTSAFLEKYGLRERFSHVSTGGGAMLEFLVKETLPGIEALK